MTERTDTERLDWLDKNMRHMVDELGQPSIIGSKEFIIDGTQKSIGMENIRWAIDNKMDEMETYPQWFQDKHYNNGAW